MLTFSVFFSPDTSNKSARDCTTSPRVLEVSNCLIFSSSTGLLPPPTASVDCGVSTVPIDVEIATDASNLLKSLKNFDEDDEDDEEDDGGEGVDDGLSQLLKSSKSLYLSLFPANFILVPLLLK